MIQIKSSYLEIMLHVCNLNLRFVKVMHGPCALPLIMKQFKVCFMSCCINSFLWWAGFHSVCFAKCWWDVFIFNLRKVYLSNLGVLWVSLCYVVIFLCHTVVKRKTKSHYLWQKSTSLLSLYLKMELLLCSQDSSLEKEEIAF